MAISELALHQSGPTTGVVMMPVRPASLRFTRASPVFDLKWMGTEMALRVSLIDVELVAELGGKQPFGHSARRNFVERFQRNGATLEFAAD